MDKTNWRYSNEGVAKIQQQRHFQAGDFRVVDDLRFFDRPKVGDCFEFDEYGLVKYKVRSIRSVKQTSFVQNREFELAPKWD